MIKHIVGLCRFRKRYPELLWIANAPTISPFCIKAQILTKICKGLQQTLLQAPFTSTHFLTYSSNQSNVMSKFSYSYSHTRNRWSCPQGFRLIPPPLENYSQRAAVWLPPLTPSNICFMLNFSRNPSLTSLLKLPTSPIHLNIPDPNPVPFIARTNTV